MLFHRFIVRFSPPALPHRQDKMCIFVLNICHSKIVLIVCYGICTIQRTLSHHLLYISYGDGRVLTSVTPIALHPITIDTFEPNNLSIQHREETAVVVSYSVGSATVTGLSTILLQLPIPPHFQAKCAKGKVCLQVFFFQLFQIPNPVY